MAMAPSPDVQKSNSLKKILEWDGDIEQLEDFYDEWAANYSSDLARKKYSAPASLMRCFLGVPHTKGGVDVSNKEIKILDAGSGTGLMGKLLHGAGYRNIDGCDLSTKMIMEARRTGAYRRLIPKADLTKRVKSIDDNQYDVTVCCGVFAGPMPSIGLNELTRVTRPGGAIVLSTRRDYCENTDFQSRVDALQRERRVELVHLLSDQPYIENETGHFWTLAKLS